MSYAYPGSEENHGREISSIVADLLDLNNILLPFPRQRNQSLSHHPRLATVFWHQSTDRSCLVNGNLDSDVRTGIILSDLCI